jgi:hypothetical protein
MIRRGFWLAVGAAGGIMGYRKARSFGRQVSQTLGLRPAGHEGRQGQAGPHGHEGRQGHEGRPGRAASRRKRHWARETIRFTRDVRAGMDQYLDRHPPRPAPTLDAAAPRPRSGATRQTDEREDR